MAREVVVQTEFEPIDMSGELHAGPLSKRYAARRFGSWPSHCLVNRVVKLTRLNHQTIVINPDNLLWAEASPDTVLCFLEGEKVLVRESMDQLIDRVIEWRRKICSEFPQTRRDVEG